MSDSDPPFTDLLPTALELARLGLPVFPCYPDKRPAANHGWRNATADPKLIRRFLWYDRLIGVPTGSDSGFVVLDIDPRNGGEAWALANLNKLPRTRAHQTQSGGYHLLFQHPGYEVSNSAGLIASGIDVRGDGGYVIWWPVHGYEVVNDDGLDCELPIWPDWLIPPKPPRSKPRGSVRRVDRYELLSFLEFVASAKNGERNSQLFWAACRMGELLGPGLDEEDALDLLVEAAGLVGLGEQEAEKTARSGLRKGKG